MKYVQSFYQYPVLFSSIGKAIPAKDADGELRNIAEIEDEELETLERSEPMFNALVSEKKYRVLKKLPDSYKPSSQLLNEAREEAEKAKQELAALKAAGKGKKVDPDPKSDEQIPDPDPSATDSGEDPDLNKIDKGENK
ncbi:hypothetical protein [Treponema sp. Marseille-Q4130]|uniref:hypothetical protein n=1 Tax=Treponema sp. Marseille-Q4130 TaxID=2766702 RepID=UPI001651F9F4|nr:hypothetical protein [Treponema sp. Marseille-Q4130]MBC6720315.1 hypothetical protein [Treponema sp. Marseille-Q4130]